MKPVKVVLADDHDLVRSMVRKFLEREPGIKVVGEACNGAEAIEQVNLCRPDILILDMEMPILNGVQVTDKLQQAGSPVKVLALSAYDDLNYVQGALESGATGYILKDDLPEGFTKVVMRVAQGEKDVLSGAIAVKLKEANHQVDDGLSPNS